MISGPVLPRTRVGLWNLMVQNADRFEHSFTLLLEDLRLDEHCHADALGRDALGRAVLVHLVLPENEADLVPRILAAQAGFLAHGALLRQAIASLGLRGDLPPRAWVVGLELPRAMLEQLAALRLEDLEAFEVRGMLLGGELHVGVVPLLGRALGAGEHAFTPPGGIEDPTLKTCCSRLLDLVHRLEPSLRLEGDRYGRRLMWDGAQLADLRLRQGVLEIVVSDPQSPRVMRIAQPDDVPLALDAVMRRYLELLESEGTRDPAAASRCSTESIRRAVIETKLSKEELSALGGTACE